MTIMSTFGLTPQDWESSAGEGYGPYYQNYFDQYDIRNRNQLLDEIIA